MKTVTTREYEGAGSAADVDNDDEADQARGSSMESPSVTITPQENGPLSIVGPVALTNPDGSVEIVERITLCRCGQSNAKPRCDGSHVRVGFTAPGFSASRTNR